MSQWLIERAGVQITVNAKSDLANQLVISALASMAPELVEQPSGIELTVDYNDEHWYLSDRSSGLKRKVKQSGDLIYHLTDRLVFHVANATKQAHCLHAAAVSDNQNALLIPADSGAGKSSLTCWLVANGFAYLTDELILLEGDRTISGIARPIQIKSHGINAIESLLINPELIFKGGFANAIPIDALGGVVNESHKQSLSMILFPQYTQASGFEFKKISSAQAGMKLMGSHVNARNLEGHGFREIMAIIRETPCYELNYGGFDQLPVDFDKQIKTILASGAE